MTMQTEHPKAAFIDTARGQAVLAIAALVILAALAWLFIG